MQKNWDKIYNKSANYGASLSFLPAFSKLLKKNRKKKVLDLGCGGGKHLLYLAECGFDTYGIDISKKAVSNTQKLLTQNNQRAKLFAGSKNVKTPFEDNFFDAIISIRVLNHGSAKEISTSIKEIYRILNLGGLILVSFQKITRKNIAKNKKGEIHINNLPVKMLSTNTYRPLDGPEKGIVHSIINQKDILKRFNEFKIIKFWNWKGKQIWEDYYYFIAEKVPTK